MTTSALRTCPACTAPIPAGAMFCLQCGASSPTEISAGSDAPPVPGAETPTRATAPLDLEARRAEVKAALGDGFEVRGLVGRGGFGEVWAAFDVQLSRDVAVKVLHTALATNPEYRERFRREARAIARLRHPGIVPIYHVGEANGLVWFVMPLVEGMTLKAALASPDGLSPDESLRILLEVLVALKEAHAHGIVHRDLKPENIMLEGPQRRALIMDFGVAKMEEPGAVDITEVDMVVGSPEYMSPEQATGRALDARSDIYSIGVVAYRMLAGRLPFVASTSREVLAHHVLSPPTHIDAYTHLPETLSGAVMRCLAKNPLERWQTADELLAALTAQAPRRSVLAALAPRLPEPRAEPAKRPRFSRRRKRWSIALGLLALAVIAPWPVARWRLHQRWAAAAATVGRDYNEAADSVAARAAAFVSGEIGAPQYLAAHDEIVFVTQAGVDERHGTALDDSSSWSARHRTVVRAATARLASAGLAAGWLGLRASDVAGCTMRTSNDTMRLRDDAPGDNCWFHATGMPAARGPVEYYARFRLAAVPRADAGVGLAWCRSDGDCRVAFLWPATLVWGAHRPHRGMNILASAPRASLLRGEHELRVRYQDGAIRAWLDGGLVLERRSTADAAWLERPGSFHLVVQNIALDLPSPAGLGMAGARPGRD